MSVIDQSFANLCHELLSRGKQYTDESRDVTRLQIPSYTFRHNLCEGFPALSLKELPFPMIATELLWFLRGDTDIAFLHQHNTHIWDKDAYNFYVKHHSGNTGNNDGLHKNEDGSYRMLTFEEFVKRGWGSVGQNYSAQWRNFNNSIDQIKKLIVDMKENIFNSRLRVVSWNPCELDQTALPPCHSEFQIVGVPQEGKPPGFELHWNQRSTDVFLGLPFNIASYGLLAHILAIFTGYEPLAIEGTLKCVHFYENQIAPVTQMLIHNDPDKHDDCELVVDMELLEVVQDCQDIEDTMLVISSLKPTDFTLYNYTSYDPIRVKMLAPKSI